MSVLAIVRSITVEIDSSAFERVIRCSEADDFFAVDVGASSTVVIIEDAGQVDDCARVVAGLTAAVSVGAQALIDTVKSVAGGRVRAAGDRAALRRIVGPWAFTGDAYARAAATGVRDPLAAALAAGLDVQTIECGR